MTFFAASGLVRYEKNSCLCTLVLRLWLICLFFYLISFLHDRSHHDENLIALFIPQKISRRTAELK